MGISAVVDAGDVAVEDGAEVVVLLNIDKRLASGLLLLLLMGDDIDIKIILKRNYRKRENNRGWLFKAGGRVGT